MFKSRKPIAERFKDWIIDIIKKLRNEGKYEMESLKNTIEQLKAQNIQSESNNIMEAFSNKYIIYIAFIKDIDDKKLIKIGSTKNIKTRYTSLVESFGNIQFMKAYECDMNEKFEKFLHKHKSIQPFAYIDVIHNGHKSSEAFLMNDEEIQKVYRIIKANNYKYNQQFTNDQLEEMKEETQEERIRTNINNMNNDIKSYFHDVADKQMDDILANWQNNELFSDKMKNQIKNCRRQRKFTNGKKIQIYSPDGKQLIKTYETGRDVESDISLDNPSCESIKKAVENNSVYRKHRWAFLERQLDNDTVQELAETVETKIVKLGYVAMLNLNKDEIVKVFANAKEASADRKFSNGAAISKALKLGTQSGGHYFKMWVDCDELLQEKYLDKNELPPPAIPKNAYIVQQIHPITNNVIKTYYSISAIEKEMRCGRKAILDAIQDNYIFKNSFWKRITSYN